MGFISSLTMVTWVYGALFSFYLLLFVDHQIIVIFSGMLVTCAFCPALLVYVTKDLA